MIGDNESTLLQTEIVRNKPVFALGDHLFWSHIEADNEENSSIDYILHEICHENESYERLYERFAEAAIMGDDDFFVKVYKMSDKYAIRFLNEKIMLFSFSEGIGMAGKDILPWRYPNIISQIGITRSEKIEDVATALLEMTILDYFCKYMFNTNNTFYNIIKEGDSYRLSDGLKVKIDCHIRLIYQNAESIQTAYDIADAWFYEDNEILEDLSKLSFIAFGEKYRAGWR